MLCLLALNFLWDSTSFVLVCDACARSAFAPGPADDFMAELMPHLKAGQYDAAESVCEGDPRALPRLAKVAISHRDIGYEPMRQLVSEVLQRDILGGLDRHHGLDRHGDQERTAVGALWYRAGNDAAFGRIGIGQTVKPSQIADEISIASSARPWGWPRRSPSTTCSIISTRASAGCAIR